MPLYLVTSPTGKQYVGITTLTVNRRMTGHRTAARQGSPYPLHAAIRKHGFDAMRVEVLNTSRDLAALHALEIETIAKLNTEAPNGYNLTAGGEGTTGHVVSDEHREAIGQRMSERWDDPDFVAMRKRNSSETAKRMNADPAHKAKLQAGARAYWTPEKYAERGKVVAPKQRALWADPEFKSRALAAMQEGLRKPESRAKISTGVSAARAKQTPERRREIAQMAVAARAVKRAEIDALPAEERDRIKAELSAAKSAVTKAGRAAKKAARTPEQEAETRERYRQAALRRTPEQQEKLNAARALAFAKRKAEAQP